MISGTMVCPTTIGSEGGDQAEGLLPELKDLPAAA
eukprot:COSAG06_NODE_9216_length_1957_cov_1.358988_2_plen_35_part_00